MQDSLANCAEELQAAHLNFSPPSERIGKHMFDFNCCRCCCCRCCRCCNHNYDYIGLVPALFLPATASVKCSHKYTEHYKVTWFASDGVFATITIITISVVLALRIQYYEHDSQLLSITVIIYHLQRLFINLNCVATLIQLSHRNQHRYSSYS